MVDHDVVLGPERARDDRPLRMLVRLLGREPALSHELLDQRVVVRAARHLPVAQAVEAAVADVRDDDLVLSDIGGGERRPHAGALLVGARLLVDARVGLAHELHEPLLDGARLFGQPSLEHRYGDARGDFTRLGAAHAVGDREQRRPRVQGVLVDTALPPGVGPRELVDDPQHARLVSAPGT
jgi:hypothetical protein